MEWKRDGFLISTDPARLDRDAIHRFLAGSYWARGIPRPVVERSIDHSMPFGIYEGPVQVGFARVITDRATFAYLADVFVLESHRGHGLAQWLMKSILGHPDLQGLRRWILVTRDAQGLYRRFGFREVEDAARYMEIVDREVYNRS
jgi:GNAT superfamily N-acetyltransferase